MTLDSCFADLPSPVGAQMVATKQSSDNRVRIRIAIDDENRVGTAGGTFWGFIRLAVEVDGDVTCIKDRASLNYTNTHHNCVDSATAISGSMTYSLTMPNRSPAEITIVNNTLTLGTWILTNNACTVATASRVIPNGCQVGAC